MLLTALLKNHCFCLNFTIIFSEKSYLKPGNLLVKLTLAFVSSYISNIT